MGYTRDTRDTRGRCYTRHTRGSRIAIFALLWLTAALFWTYQMHFFRLAIGRGGVPPLVGGRADMVSAAVWLLLTPGVLLLARRLPVNAARPAPGLALHTVLAVGIALLEIVLVHATGIMGARPIVSAANLNVFILDVVVYGALVAWAHGDAFARWFEQRRNADARLEAQVAGAQWRARTLELRPRLLFRTLDAIAALVPRDARAADALILQFATLLRQLLDVAGHATVPLDRELELLRATLALRRGAGAGGATLTLLVQPGLGALAVPNGLLRALAEELLDPLDEERDGPAAGAPPLVLHVAVARAPRPHVVDGLDIGGLDADGLDVDAHDDDDLAGVGDVHVTLTRSGGAPPLRAPVPSTHDETLTLLQRAGLADAVTVTRPAAHVVRLALAARGAASALTDIDAGPRVVRAPAAPVPLESIA